MRAPPYIAMQQCRGCGMEHGVLSPRHSRRRPARFLQHGGFRQTLLSTLKMETYLFGHKRIPSVLISR